MNNIILTVLENKYPLNNFNFLAFKTRNTTSPNNEIINMHIVYHWISYVHSISCKFEICSAKSLHPLLLLAVKQNWLPRILWHGYIL